MLLAGRLLAGICVLSVSALLCDAFLGCPCGYRVRCKRAGHDLVITVLLLVGIDLSTFPQVVLRVLHSVFHRNERLFVRNTLVGISSCGYLCA